VIAFDKVCKAFGERRILEEMSFAVDEGETYVIMGQSGIGKSTTLKIMIGMLEPDSGRVAVDGRTVPELDRKGLMALRADMGFLFQYGALINWLTVFENVALPLRERRRMAESEIQARVRENLVHVEMAHAADLLPDQISGGMRKRVAIARALVTRPRILLYDEPTSGLDPIMAANISQLIVDVQERFKVTSVVVTHNRGSAFLIGDKIALMSDGRMVAQGTPEQMRQSDNPLVRKFLGGADE
jgi:phospholipid/cholesterol/gamma-HCH transport system ATP-binding protein